MTMIATHELREQNVQSTNRTSAEPFGLKVAFVHDWLTGMRGGEKVLEALCGRFPKAPLWTLLHLPGTVSQTINARPIHTSILQRMPLVKEKYRHYLPLFPLFAELHKAGDADLVISTSHAVAKAMVQRPGNKRPFHICYIHTPMRYAWDMFDDYFGPERVGWLASHIFFRPLVKILQAYDRRTSHRVDLFIANSRYVAERVKRIYGRNSLVLPPPVATDRFSAVERKPGEAYLVVSALVPYKRISDAIHACGILGRKLRIVGKGPELQSLKDLARQLGVDVEFIGFASDADLAAHYAGARALLFPGVEDFGIVPVEAIACGCPVIALGVGGILDSMTSETAVLYNDPTAAGLAEGMLQFEQREHSFATSALRARAEVFSTASFAAAFERILLLVQTQIIASRMPAIRGDVETATWPAIASAE